MSFTPVVPFTGYAGWKFLQRTMDSQREAFAASPPLKRDAAYFRENIGSIKTAEDLVSNRRLLAVALGAFGLESDIGNTYFIRKVLEDGTLQTSDLANKLSDKRYLEFSKAFGFGDYSVPSTQLSDFADKIVALYENKQFEAAVGDQSDDMRLAMNAERELRTIAEKTSSDDTKWYSILGSTPLRQVVQTALGLPSSIAAIDLDQQLTAFKEKAERSLGIGKVSDLAEGDKMNDLIRLFLLRSETQATISSTSSGSSALILLQNSASSSSANLLSLLR